MSDLGAALFGGVCSLVFLVLKFYEVVSLRRCQRPRHVEQPTAVTTDERVNRDYGQDIAYEEVAELSRSITQRNLYVVYALNLARGSLESDRGLYVGSTLRSLETRMREHWGEATSGFPGAKVTQRNSPLSIHTIRTFATAEEALQGEIDLYEHLERTHGSKNVRGAYFCWSTPGERVFDRAYYEEWMANTRPSYKSSGHEWINEKKHSF